MIVWGTPWMIKRYRVSVRVTLQLAAYGSEAGMERTSVHNLWQIGRFVIGCPWGAPVFCTSLYESM